MKEGKWIRTSRKTVERKEERRTRGGGQERDEANRKRKRGRERETATQRAALGARARGMEEQGKRKRGGTRNAGIDSRRQPATSLKHTTESTRLRDSETRFTTVTHHSDHRREERERGRENEKLLD